MAKSVAKSRIKAVYELETLIEEDVLSYQWRGCHVQTKEPVIIFLYKEEYLDGDIIRDVLSLADRLAKVQNPHLVRLLDSHYDGQHLAIVYQLKGTYRSFSQLLAKNHKMKDSRLWELAMQLLHLHVTFESLGIVSGITFRHLYIDGQTQLKVLNPAIHLSILSAQAEEIVAIEDALCYPPEFLQQSYYDRQSDIYGFGMLLYVMFSRTWPYPQTIKIAEAKRAMLAPPKRFKSYYPKVPKQLSGIIGVCLQQNPDKRFASFAELMAAYKGEIPLTRPGADQQEAPAIEAIKSDLKNQQLRKIGFRVQLGLLVAVLAVFGLLGRQLYVNYLTGIPDVKVPDIKALSYEEAAAVLESSKFQVELGGERFHPTVPVGHVIETKPRIGREVKQKRPIRVFLSKGPIQLTVPNLTGRKLEQATLMLGSAAEHLEVVEAQYSAEYEIGTIMSQVPTPNTFLGPSENIEVIVSKGFPIEMTVEEIRGFMFRKRSDRRRVLLDFFVLEEWPAQEITVYYEKAGERDMLHRKRYNPGKRKTLSFELDYKGTVEILVDDEVVLSQKVIDGDSE